MAIVDIIVPVQTGIEAVRRCVESVLAATGKTRYELILINDSTAEPELARYLRDVR
jgi:glycosyltransferase involved in cell wall biosynthesis